MGVRKKICAVLGVTGSIAAYKAAELVRLMVGKGWDVRVIMTRAATQFVGPVTFQTLSRNPVALEMFGEIDEWIPGHISLADWADVMVIAPCTANVLAKLAHGMADDLLSCTALASTAPLVLAPAMNSRMWDHPATRSNLKTLKGRGAHVMDVENGSLACGAEGRGRMAAPAAVLAAAAAAVGGRK